jgi:DNA-binding CsgD family transcriptional regulator
MARVVAPGTGYLARVIQQVITSIYRKLGASSRDQAVMRARDLGLLDR